MKYILFALLFSFVSATNASNIDSIGKSIVASCEKYCRGFFSCICVDDDQDEEESTQMKKDDGSDKNVGVIYLWPDGSPVEFSGILTEEEIKNSDW